MSDLSLTEPIAEAARSLLAAQMHIICIHAEAVRDAANVTSVHEMRKAIRRSFTAFSLFEPYFQPEALMPFQRPLRKLMKRLGRARDLAVLGQNLEQYWRQPGAEQMDAGNLPALQQYIHTQQTAAEARFQAYLQQEKVHDFFHTYKSFLQTPGAGALPQPRHAFIQVRHLLPVLIYQRLAAVLVFSDSVYQANLTLPELHQLRLRAKELRYTLEFFAPLPGPTFSIAYATLKRLLEHLGEQNDAYVGGRWLEKQLGEVDMPALHHALHAYQQLLQQRLDHLLAEFPAIWAEFDHPAWRINLALSLPV
ncbi:MAG: hypothetical protein Fur0021_36110 [Candidatus Promineifilaceae bacterium]